MNSMIARVIDFCAGRAGYVLVAAALVTVGALVYAATHFAIDTDTAKLIAADVPFRQRETAFDVAFPQRADPIAIVIDSAVPELAEGAAARLSERLAQDSAHFRQVRRPEGGPFFDRNGLLFGTPAELSQTMQRLIAAQPLLATLAADPSLRGLMDALALMVEGVRREPARLGQLESLFDPLAEAFEAIAAGAVPRFSWQAMVSGGSPDPRALRRFVLVQPVLDYQALQPGAQATAAIRTAARELGLAGDPRVRIRLTGPVPLGDEEFATLAEGAGVNAAATLLAVVMWLWLALRSGRLIFIVLASLLVGLCVTAAFGLLAYGRFNLISVAFAVLFVGLGVDFGIQFGVAYRTRLAAGDEIANALHATGTTIGTALALAAAATCAGFYAFAPTRYRGLSELGVIAGSGMLIAFVATITVVPALVAVLRPRGGGAHVGFPWLAPADRWLSNHHRLVLGASLLIAIACLAFVPKLVFDFNPLNLRSASTESVATLLDLMRDPLTSPSTIDVLAPSIDDAALLARKLEQLPEVERVLTLASFVPDRQQEKLPLIEDAALLLAPVLDPPGVKPAPSDSETAGAMLETSRALHEVAGAQVGAGSAAAKRLADVLQSIANGDSSVRERARAALAPGLVTTLAQVRAALQAQPVALQNLPADLRNDWVARDGRVRIEVFPRGSANDNASLQRFVAAVTAIAPDATGAPISIQESGRTIVSAFVQAGVIAFIASVALLAFALRNVRDVVLALVPLVFSGLATLAICAATQQPLNYANIIALPLLFGIGVAFNIYYVMAARAGRVDLLQSSLTRAVLFSALTTGTAFGSLWLSHHPGTASMGKLLALSLACTLVAALVVLPAMLAGVHDRRG